MTNLGRLLPAAKLAKESGIFYTAHPSDEPVSLTWYWKQIVVLQPTLAGRSLPFDFNATTSGARWKGYTTI